VWLHPSLGSHCAVPFYSMGCVLVAASFPYGLRFLFACGKRSSLAERLCITCIGCGYALRVAPSFNKASITMTSTVSISRLNPSLGSIFALVEAIGDSICSLHLSNISCGLSCNCGLATQVVKYTACYSTFRMVFSHPCPNDVDSTTFILSRFARTCSSILVLPVLSISFNSGRGISAVKRISFQS
jgi:hypothetical protein